MIETAPILDNAFVRLQMAASHAATSPHNDRRDPTARQALAGNYKKAPFRWNGLLLMLENVRNSVRSGTSPDGKEWSNRLASHYGEIAGTVGNDGDPIDVFVGLFPELSHVWVINQGNADGTFDEHKCMFGFATEDQARDAYMLSFDRGWTGLLSMVPATLTQFKWWLKHGDKSRQFSLDQLPFDGQPAMSKTLWNAAAEPTTLPMNQLVYSLRSEDAVAGLLLDAVTMGDIMSDPDVTAIPMLDALVVEVSKLTIKMNLLQKVMNGVGSLSVPSYQISDPVKARGVLQVAVLFELSDGQTITVWFHNPDSTPSKLMPLDELISWKWMLNKKDITIVVAPERGKDLQVREVARRIMKLAERNGPAFAKANAKLAQKIEEGFRIDSEIVGLEKRLVEVTHQVEVARQNRIDAGAAATGSTEEEIAAVDALEARIAAIREQLAAMSDTDVHLVAMTAPLTHMITPGADRDDVIAKILSNHPDDIEAAIAAHAAYKAQPEPKLEDPGVLPEGWTESYPGGMAAWNDPVRGGIVDQNKQNGQWFIVFNNDQIPNDDRGFANRAEAFEAFAEGLSKITPAVAEPVAVEPVAEVPAVEPAAVEPAAEPAPKVKRVTKGEAEEAYDTLSYLVNDLAGHTPLEFFNANVPERLEGPVVAIRALQDRGWPEKATPPGGLLERATAMIERWNEEHEQGVSEAVGGKLGRGDAHTYLRRAGLDDVAIAEALATPTSVRVAGGSIEIPEYTVAYLDERIAAFAAPAEETPAAEEPAAAEPVASGPTFAVGEFLTADFAKLNKQGSIEEYREQTAVDNELCKVEKVLTLTPEEWDEFADNLLEDNTALGNGGSGNDDPTMPADLPGWSNLPEEEKDRLRKTMYRVVTVVSAPGRETFVADPQGYAYARYVGLDPKPAANPFPEAAAPVAEPAPEVAAPKAFDDMSFEEAQARAGELWSASEVTSAAMNGFPKGPMGLTPDDVRATPEWQAAKAAADADFEALRSFNGPYSKKFKKEIAAARQAEREAKLAASQAAEAAAEPAPVEEPATVEPAALPVADAEAPVEEAKEPEQPIDEVNMDKHHFHITIAADSIAELRKSDVDRVLGAVRPDNIDGVTRESLAAWITANRADLAEEVAEVMAELARQQVETRTEVTEEAEAQAAAAPADIVSTPSEEVHAAKDADEEADRAYLESLIDGSGDLLSEDTFPRMEPMFAKYAEGTEMFTLLEKAATIFGDAVQDVARQAMAA